MSDDILDNSQSYNYTTRQKGIALHIVQRKGQTVIFVHGASVIIVAGSFRWNLFQGNIAQSLSAEDSLFPIRQQGTYLKIPQLK